jgi:hypothetical protein
MKLNDDAVAFPVVAQYVIPVDATYSSWFSGVLGTGIPVVAATPELVPRYTACGWDGW